MIARYVALVGRDRERAGWTLRQMPGLEIVLDLPDLLLACDGTDRIDLGMTRGTIIGTLFDRATNLPCACLPESEIRAVLETRGTALIERYWGNYVAVLATGGGTVTFLRDPSGAVPCYVWTSPSGAPGPVVTSDVRACAAMDVIAASIDWPALAAHLLWPDRRTQRTCLDRLRELVPGARLEVERENARVDAAWLPWHFTSSDRQIDTPDEAAEAVRTAVVDSSSAWGSCYARPLISLSGGLDSSIVTACARHPIGAMTLVTHEALGDERRFASAVANRYAVPLIERRMIVDAVDPAKSHAASLPRPVSRLFAQEIDRLWAETIDTMRADALYHGGGGDSVFCYLASSMPYLDAVLTRRPTAVRQAVLDSLSRMTGVSRWRIRRAALRKFLLDRGRYRWQRDPRLLTSLAIRLAWPPERHPWLADMPSGTLPGKQAQMAALVGIQNYLEAVTAPQPVPVIAPLMSQPIVETCLRIPTWLWCRDGNNRMVARDAFRDTLPALVIDRRSKGSPVAFGAQMVAAKRRSIRRLLHEGHLAAMRLIDLDAVDQALGNEGPLRGNAYLRVTTLVDVEAWLQTWIGTGSPSFRAQS